MIDGLKAHQKVVNMEWPGYEQYETFIHPEYDLWETEQKRQFKVAWALLGEYLGALWD